MFQSYLVLGRIGFSLRPDIVLWYSPLLDFPYLLIVKPIGICYAFFYYLYHRFPKDIRHQLKNDPKKRAELMNPAGNSNRDELQEVKVMEVEVEE
jgi:hypothetical protein